MCGYESESQTFLDNHLKMHSDTVKSDFDCQFDCALSFSSMKENVDHMLEIHHKFTRKCSLCSQTTQDLSKLRIHYYAVHLKIKPYSCKFCSQNFACKRSANRHIDMKRCKKMDQISRDAIIQNLEEFTRPTMIFLNDKKNEKGLLCEECGKSFNYRSHLLTHVQKTHKMSKSLDHGCNECQKKYSSVASASNHMRQVHQMFIAWTPEELLTK